MISAEKLKSEIDGIIASYAEEVSELLEESAEEVAKAAVKQLKDISPKRHGDYAKGWTKTKDGKKGWVVHNKTHYRLTHLLEKGHAKVNGGRTAAQPHIITAEQKVITDFERMVTEGLNR